MLSIEKIKKLLGRQDVSDEEAKEIRDGFYNLAEIIFEHSQNVKNLNSDELKNKNNNINNIN